ncbi:981_t:CDS:1, partial [Ambispora leptoticha]
MPKKLRPKVLCYCKECDGKLVETRTRKKHERNENRLQESISNLTKSKKANNPTPVCLSNLKNRYHYRSISVEPFDGDTHEDNTVAAVTDDGYQYDSFSECSTTMPSSITKKRKRQRYNQFQRVNDIISSNTSEEESEQQVNPSSDLSSSDEGSYDLNNDEGLQTIDLNNADLDLEDYVDDLFTAPDSFNIDYDSDQEIPTSMNDNLWILLWIFKFQERFTHSDVAIGSLIGFFNIFLKNIKPNKYNEFPSTIHMARKLLEIKKKSKTYAVCPTCDKLYNLADIMPNDSTNVKFDGFKCTYIEFSKHPMKNQ